MQGGTRVYCLYRVSLTRQADHVHANGQIQTDIPMQKEACRKFCQEHGWEIVNSFTEPGVSGYKNSIFDRDSIRDILTEASEGNYDILLVYTLDRLSRRDYELPILMQRLHQEGITVWSAQEGEIPYNNSTDHLLLYMQGWKAYGESERISQRITTIQGQIVMKGEYRGGAIPYGYKLIESGEVSKQGRKRHLLAIHEPEANIVRMIFRKIVDEGCSMYEMTRFLSQMERPTDTRKMVWRSATLHVLLRNRIYVGQQRFLNEHSLPFERLQIIDPVTFNRVQQLTTKKKRRLPGKRAIVEPPPLYHDLVYCGHCGGHLVYNHAFDKHKDGSYTTRYYYRCYNRERFVDPCNGASTFSARQVDADVRMRTESLVRFLMESPVEDLVKNSAELSRTEYLIQRENLQKKLSVLNNQLETLQVKLTDMLRLYGIEATSELQLVYQDVRDSRDGIYHTLQKTKPEHYEMEHLLKIKEKNLKKILLECEHWTNMDWKEAEKMTPRFFERIEVHQGYQLEYKIVPEILQFLPTVCSLKDETKSLPSQEE